MTIQIGNAGFDIQGCKALGKELFLSTYKGKVDLGNTSLETVWDMIEGSGEEQIERPVFKKKKGNRK